MFSQSISLFESEIEKSSASQKREWFLGQSEPFWFRLQAESIHVYTQADLPSLPLDVTKNLWWTWELKYAMAEVWQSVYGAMSETGAHVWYTVEKSCWKHLPERLLGRLEKYDIGFFYTCEKRANLRLM